MLNNKLLLTLSVLAIAAVIFASIYLGTKQRKLSPVINAIPKQTSFILETDDFTYLINKISKNENITQILSDLKLTKGFYNDFKKLDSIIRYNKNVKQFFTQKTVIISAHVIGQNDVEYLFATGSFKTGKDLDNLNSLIKELYPNSIKNTISFAGAEITHQKLTNEKEVFYSFYEDYLLYSYSELIIQKAIKNINSGASLFSDTNFKSLYEKAKNSNDAKLYINYDHFFNTGSNVFNTKFSDKQKLLSNFADWSTFDINIKRKEIKLTGHTTLKPEMQFLKIFKSVSPGKSDILKILPEKTSSFILLNIGKGQEFRYRYEDYLAEVKDLNDHQIKMATFYKNFNVKDDEQDLYMYAENEIALVFEDVKKTDKEQNLFCILESNDISKSKDFLLKLTETYCKKNNENTADYNNVNKGNSDEFKINKLPIKDLPQMYFGILFKNINAEFYTTIEDFIIFGENTESLLRFIDSYQKDKTLKRKSQNYKFIKSLPDESNIFFYLDLFHSKFTIENILVENLSKKFTEDINSFIAIQGPAIQFISDSYPIYTTCNIMLNSREQNISETVWEVRLDTLIDSKPYVVLNHMTSEKEIVIQDKANKLYLIDKTGKILWSRQLDGKIISEIYQIDFYNNGKLQFIFNTNTKIYCIDRLGNWLENYPVNLKSEATNGISLIDYDNDKNYRIFVATIDKKISLYDKTGNYVEGWEFDKTKGNVYGKIKLYQNNDTDYLVFRDNSNFYILNRKGQMRVKPEVSIPISVKSEVYYTPENNLHKAHFTVSNPSGAVYFIYETGEVQKKEIEPHSKDHVFSYYDINGDNIPDYIFTDKNQTIAYNGLDDKRLFTYTYDQDIIHDIVFYQFSSTDIRIGTGSKDKIYLIDNNGNLCEGFPLIGSGLFSITIFDSINEFSLIVGNKDNYLYKYKIK